MYTHGLPAHIPAGQKTAPGHLELEIKADGASQYGCWELNCPPPPQEKEVFNPRTRQQLLFN